MSTNQERQVETMKAMMEYCKAMNLPGFAFYPNMDYDPDATSLATNTTAKRSEPSSPLPSPPPKRVCTPEVEEPKEEADSVVEKVYLLCREHLSDIWIHPLPSVEELLQPVEVPDEMLQHWSELTAIPTHMVFLQKACEELARGTQNQDLMKLAVCSGPKRKNSDHTCTPDGYCACERKFFRSKHGISLQKLLEEARRHTPLWLKFCKWAQAKTKAKSKKCTFKQLKSGRSYALVKRGLDRFIGDVKHFNEQLNAMFAIVSFSSFMEAKLLSRSTRPKCDENLFTGAGKELVKQYPHIQLFHQEVKQMIAEGLCTDMDDLYDKLWPLIDALNPIRGLPALKKRE